MKDITVMLVSKEENYFKEFSSALNGDASLNVTYSNSGAEVLEAAAKNDVDVVVAAEDVQEGSGLDLIKQVVVKNPFVNTALVSPLDHKEFHEVTEGLGVFLQLSPLPGREDAVRFREYLVMIY